MSEMTGQHISEGPISLFYPMSSRRAQPKFRGVASGKQDISLTSQCHVFKKGNDKFLQVWVYHSLINW